MTVLRTWTARHTMRIDAPPKRVFELVADVDRWPALVEPLVAVEHRGLDGRCERVRFVRRDGDLTLVRELDQKRLRVRFRQVAVRPPLASMGGYWSVASRGFGSLVALDHYFRVLDDDPAGVAAVEGELAAESTAMLRALRRTLELSGLAGSCAHRMTAEGMP